MLVSRWEEAPSLFSAVAPVYSREDKQRLGGAWATWEESGGACKPVEDIPLVWTLKTPKVPAVFVSAVCKRRLRIFCSCAVEGRRSEEHHV